LSRNGNYCHIGIVSDDHFWVSVEVELSGAFQTFSVSEAVKHGSTERYKGTEGSKKIEKID
jgi:hypothetical protein